LQAIPYFYNLIDIEPAQLNLLTGSDVYKSLAELLADFGNSP
jgi:hypothetical protein